MSESIYQPQRERTAGLVQSPRPQYKGKPFSWLAQFPAVKSSANLPHRMLCCLPASEGSLLWQAPACPACLLLLLPSDQQLFYAFPIVPHCTFVALLPTSMQFTFMYWRTVVFVACYYVPEQPYEVELKGAELQRNFHYDHFSSLHTLTRAFMIVMYWEAQTWTWLFCVLHFCR